MNMPKEKEATYYYSEFRDFLSNKSLVCVANNDQDSALRDKISKDISCETMVAMDDCHVMM